MSFRQRSLRTSRSTSTPAALSDSACVRTYDPKAGLSAVGYMAVRMSTFIGRSSVLLARSDWELAAKRPVVAGAQSIQVIDESASNAADCELKLACSAKRIPATSHSDC